MGFLRRESRRIDNDYKKKGKLKTQIRIIGGIILVIGFIIFVYANSQNQILITYQQSFLIFVGLFVLGNIMLFQEKLLVALKNMAKNDCQCCDCQNCGRYHNHWVHRDGDTRRNKNRF